MLGVLGDGRSNQAQFAGLEDRLSAPFDAQLSIDIAGVAFDGVEGDDQFRGDFGVGLARADQA